MAFWLDQAPDGYATLVFLSLISLGIIMTAIGLLAVYVSKIFNEVKGRPRYIVSEEINSSNKDNG